MDIFWNIVYIGKYLIVYTAIPLFLVYALPRLLQVLRLKKYVDNRAIILVDAALIAYALYGLLRLLAALVEGHF